MRGFGSFRSGQLWTACLVRRYSDVNQASTNLWGDAYLAAYATVNGATLVTFNQGFVKYSVKSLILKSQ